MMRVMLYEAAQSMVRSTAPKALSLRHQSHME